MEVHVMSNGATLHVKDGLFEILSPQASDSNTFLRHEYAVSHVSSIWMHAAANVTTAAIRLAIENDIDFVLCDHHGMPLGRFMPHRPSTTAAVQKAQLVLSQTAHAITYVKDWILHKLKNQIVFLTELSDRRKEEPRKLCRAAAKKIEAIRQKIKALEGKHISEIADVLRGMEGAACRVYFETLNAILPKYYRFEGGRSRQPANDLFNAFLNYGYAILYNRVEIAVTQAGLNPFIGYLHRDEFGAFRAFVFDTIEPYRIEIERIVFNLFASKDVTYEQHGAVAQTDKAGIWLSVDGKKLIAARFTESFEKWHTTLHASMRHIAATMRKQLGTDAKEGITEPLSLVPHLFG